MSNNPIHGIRKRWPIRQETGARAVILIFDRGPDGVDFSVQAMDDLIDTLPEYLEDLTVKLREMRARGWENEQ